MSPLPTGSTIGIIGGGQLGRMLAMAAARFGYRVTVLEPGADCPATQVANRHVVAAYDDPDALVELAATCDVVTYEFENVPLNAATTLSSAATLRPGPEALRVAGPSYREGAPELDWAGHRPIRPINGRDEVKPALETVGFPSIIKTRRLGYDGKGQVRLDAPPSPSDDLFEDMGGVPLIAEGFVDFECEISVIVARSTAGEVASFTPAANEHEGGILRRSVVPAPVADETRAAAHGAGAALIESLDYVGALGLELFVLEDGSLLVNEFAPRVHNSGHWTELACPTDQFEQHIRAITGHPLGDTAARACEMVNLIGDDLDRWADLVADGHWRVHLYGKGEVRPGRRDRRDPLTP